VPNWCEGDLKVRGSKEDIINFLKGVMQPVDFLGASGEQKIVEDEFHFKIEPLNGEWGFWIAGTHRHFIESKSIDFWFEGEGEQVLVIEGFKAAWSINPEALSELSKQYNVDLRVYGFECGMQFNQEVEIHKGKIVKNSDIQFDDYDWECACPRLGG
jgi:hypothetical protein